MSVLFSRITNDLPSVYATIVGSNIGAFLTPIGALAGIMWSGLLKNHNAKFGYLDFVKYGAAISLPTLAVCLAVLALVV